MNNFSNFIHSKTFMHKMNPSLKLMITIFLIIMIFLPIGFFGQLIYLLIILPLWFSSKLPWKRMKAILISCSVMFLLLFVINWIAFKSPSLIYLNSNIHWLFFYDNYGMLGKNIITNVCTPADQPDSPSIIIPTNFHFLSGFLWGGNVDTTCLYTVKPTDSSISYISISSDDFAGIPGIAKNHTLYLYYTKNWYCLSSDVITNTTYITIKIFMMVTIVSLLVSTTSSVQLTFAIEDILSPLKYLKVPVNEWSMTISIAIRFVPSLLEESQKILKAQASRGVDFSNGNFKDKVKAIVSLVVPMFSVAFHKADDLANAMEARSYNPRYSRTRYRSYSIQWYEWCFFLFITTLLGFMITFTAFGCVFAPFSWIEAITVLG